MSIISYRPLITRIDPALIAKVRPMLSSLALPASAPMESAALVAACRTASVQAGFPQVDLLSLPGGLLRIEASDGFGRGLISEVRQDPARGLTLVTEVAGVKDGSCQTVMGKFDEALASQGVISEPPHRKSTGGVAELAAAKAFLRRTAPLLAASQSRRRTDRTRRLNSPAQAANSGRRQ